MTTPTASMGRRADARKAVPVKWWAGAGAAFLVLQIYVFSAWIASGPQRTDTGPVAPPDFMGPAVAFMNVGMPIGVAVIFAIFVVRPWIRDRRLSDDGLFVLALV